MALPLRSVTGLLVIALWAAGVAGCTSEPPKRSLFRFDTIKDRDPALVAGEVPLDGPSTYKVPARRVLYATEFGPVHEFERTVAGHGYHGDPGYGYDQGYGYGPGHAYGGYGPDYVQGYDYTELTFPSPYYLERSGQPVIHHTNRALSLEAHASHYEVASAGDLVSVRVRLRAPDAVTPQRDGLNIAIVLDATQSMAEPEKAALLRRAAHHLVNQLLPTDRVALVVFNDESQVLFPAQPADPKRLHDAIDGGVTFGGGNMAAGLMNAYDEVEAGISEGTESGHVLVLSDGLLESGSAGGWRLVELARGKKARGVHLSTVGLGSRMDASLLASLASVAEGRFGYAENPDELDTVLSAGLRPLLKVFARNILVRIETYGNAEVVSTHGAEFRRPLQGVKEFTLTDLAGGEERSLLVRLRFPPTAADDVMDIKFRLNYDQTHPVRRTHIDRVVRFEASETRGAADPLIENYARVVLAMDQIRRAVEGQQEAVARAATEMLDDDLPALKAAALASADQELIRLVSRYEYFAARLRQLLAAGKLQGASIERQNLERELYYRRQAPDETD